MEHQGQFRVTGVVLYRKDLSPTLRTLYVWCREKGAFWVFSPGSGRGKIGRAFTEPLVWGTFHLYRSTRGTYLKAMDLREDFWELRRSPLRVREALQWGGLLKKNLLPEHPEDELLRVFYWSLVLLREGAPILPLRWRFFWKWLSLWGQAPDLWRCENCGRPLEGEDVYLHPQKGGLFCSACTPLPGEFQKAESVLRELRRAVMLSRSDFSGSSFDLESWQWEQRTHLLEELLGDRC